MSTKIRMKLSLPVDSTADIKPSSLIETKFFTYNQNNSGGSFEVNESVGITHYVIVEAVDSKHANSLAEDIGLYFDGCESGMDCECCGDRWYSVDDNDGTSEPNIYSSLVDEHRTPFLNFKASIHYLDGRIEIKELKNDKE